MKIPSESDQSTTGTMKYSSSPFQTYMCALKSIKSNSINKIRLYYHPVWESTFSSQYIMGIFPDFSKIILGTSLVVQWLRIHLACRAHRFDPWLGS